MTKKIVDITVQVRRETVKAVLVSDGVTEAWLPRSQIEINISDDGQADVITLPEWLAMEKGFL